MSPVKSSKLSISYYIATLVSTLIVCLSATFFCLVYLAIVGWYMSFVDVLLLVLDVVVISLFGTALSSLINYFLNTQGQISAVGSIVSAGYGFICGAYMPISTFGAGLQKVVAFLPGTYATSLVRNHALNGVLTEMKNQSVPNDLVNGLANSLDCNIDFFGSSVGVPMMYLILGVTTALLLGVYILLNALKKKNK